MTANEPLNIPEIEVSDKITTQEYAYRRLRNAILVGAFQPGRALTIHGLADALALSQTPIRESIRRLSSENALEVLGNRRLKIPEMTLEKLQELIDIRILLETYAGKSALPYICDIIIDSMQAMDDDMDVAIEAGDIDQLNKLNQQFHKMLHCSNPRQVVMPLIESIWLQLGPFHRQLIEKVDDYYHVDRHKEILSALRRRDASSLETALKHDIKDGILSRGRLLL